MTYKGSDGYAINGYSQNTAASSNTANITGCYYLEGSGIAYTEGGSVSESDLKSEALAEKLGADYWYISKSGQVMPKVTDGKVVVPIPSPTFADGDKASSVTKDFTLPLTYAGEDGEETISWSSSNQDVITINGSRAEVKDVPADTEVTLTATTSKTQKTKTVKVTVKSDLEIEFDREYAKPGQLMKASVKNAPADTEFTYVWQKDKSTLSDSDSYTPTSADLNTFITVRASLKSTGATVAEKKIYCSKLPVVYINTEDGYGITSKETYKQATMKIQGNDSFNSTNTTLYDGGISIRGRGNSTWNMGYSKLPYKIKLDSKTNLLGFGNSKHWALLANYMDESLLRNKTSYDLSGKMGMVYLKSTNVEVILNGVYAGNYQLVGNVRIDKSRVNIHNWEDVASDAAKAIAKKEGIKGDAKDALEDYMTEHLEWITSGSLSYNGKTYQIEDYYTDLPKDSSGKTDVSGGYLFELDAYYDEVSKFQTKKNQPIMFKNPEFANTNTELFTAAQNYVQAVEDSINSEDYYTTYNGEKKHYTDLVDLDSLVRYLMLNEFYWNTETMKKSTYMYKDLGGKLFIGPVWDMDWTSNSQISAGETSNYRAWMVVTRSAEAQANSWYKTLIGDPYFVTKLYECYKENRQNFEDIVKTGGILDQQKEYLLESGNANYQAGYLMHRSTFESEVERLRTFLKNRLDWMDQQFTSVDTLLASLGKYRASSAISVTETTSAAGKVLLTAEVKNNNSIKKVGFYVNGVLGATVTVENGKAVFEVSDDLLTRTEGGLNTVQVRGMDASGNLLSGGSLSNYVDFTKAIAAEKLTGKVTVSGEAKVGAVLSAGVQDSNNSGTLSYQWMADGKAIEGANGENYTLTEAEIGKVITVAVTSSIEKGSLVSAPTDAVIKEELKNDHLIINQVYGGGANDSTPVSHSFIELYNPTDNAISLEGYSIGYLSNGKSNTPQEVKLALFGSVPSHTSYLIRCEQQDTSTPDLIKFTVSKFDQEWTQTIDNKRYQITLYKGNKVEDAVSVNEGNVEGSALLDGTISKQKAIRRIGFADTNNNTADFEVVSYKDDATAATEKYPRSLTDGAWGSGETPKPEKYYTVTFDVDGEKESVSVKEGEKASEKEAPQKEGYTFLGWYLEDQKYDFETPVSTDITLCAKWEKNETPTPDPLPDIDPKPEPKPEPKPDPKPTPSETIQAPQIVSVKSIAKKKITAVQITVEAVQGATGYQIYRKKGSKVTMIGQTSGTVFLDQNPVSGTSSYYAKAIKGSLTGKEGSAKKITLPKATTKVTAKAKTDKTVVLSWKKVKGATGYLVYRSTKKNGSYQRIAVLKKGTKCTYTDKKRLKKGMKYYYRIVTVKKKTYSPAKTTKAVKIKAAKIK
ncbi:MAG: CotH kinase family protein [Lachnospiraceae bacterium]|nr:CotH kinase family protein [Lachnospiraceae bacterium]